MQPIWHSQCLPALSAKLTLSNALPAGPKWKKEREKNPECYIRQHYCMKTKSEGRPDNLKTRQPHVDLQKKEPLSMTEHASISRTQCHRETTDKTLTYCRGFNGLHPGAMGASAHQNQVIIFTVEGKALALISNSASLRLDYRDILSGDWHLLQVRLVLHAFCGHCGRLDSAKQKERETHCQQPKVPGQAYSQGFW